MDRRSWIVALVAIAAAVVGVLLSLGGGLSASLGVALAVASLISGASFGLTGYIPVYVGIAAYGLTVVAHAAASPLTDEPLTYGLVFYIALIPGVYAVPTMLGVLCRRLMQALLDRH